MTFSISNYVNVFVWQFDRTALQLYPVILFFSVVLMFFIVSPMHKHLGKPKSAAMSALSSLALFLLPYILLLGGFWPEVGTTLSTGLYFAFLLFANTMGIVVMISASSMIAEIVEAYLERTGRRAEGAFYSGNWLVQKCATGLGIFLTGQIIRMSQLSSDAAPGQVPQEVIGDIILMYGGISIVLALIAAYWLGRFPIRREDHEARVAALATRRASQG